jgi:hypothetical protein
VSAITHKGLHSIVTLLLLVVTSTLLPAGPASSSPPGSVTSPAGAARGMTIFPGDEKAPRARSLADVVSSKIPAAPHGLADLTRALIEKATGAQPPSLERSAQELDEAASTSTKTARLALPTPDLSGDSLADVLSYEVSFDDYLSGERTYSLNALRGTDGENLWALDLGSALEVLPVTVGDIDGDDLGDVMVASLKVTPDAVGKLGQCGTQACAGVEEWAHVWDVTLVSGADGSIVWQRVVQGQHKRAYAGGSLFPPGLLTSDSAYVTTAAAILPIVSDDHDGDGNRDIVLNVFDRAGVHDYQWTSQPTTTAYGGITASLVSTSAEVLSGGSGNVLLERQQPYMAGATSLIPAGNAAGSDTGDLLWQNESDPRSPHLCHNGEAGYGCFGVESAELALELIDGATLGTTWTRTVGGSTTTDAFVESLDADLNGDGRDELLLFEEINYGEGRKSWWMGPLAGTTGTALWRNELQSFPDTFDGIVLGATGGGAGVDIMKLDLMLKVKTQNFDAVLTRLDGATGKELTQTVRSNGTDQAFGLWIGGDSDGDGVRDLIYYTIQEKAPLFSTWTIESGATGEDVTTGTVTGRAHIRPAEDLNADGRSDVWGKSITYGLTPHAVFGVHTSSSEIAWSRTSTAVTETTFAPDLSGGGGSDALYTRTIGTMEVASRIEALDGHDGHVLWTYGDPLNDPGSEPSPTPTPTTSPSPTEDPSPTPTASPTPVMQPTSTTFSDASASSGQYSDESFWEAKVLAGEEPVVGAPVTFTLARGGSVRTLEALTGADGSASVTPQLVDVPGDYALTVRYEGDESREASDATTTFTIEREDSVLDLSVAGQGQDKTLQARLSDADTQAAGIGGQTIDFYSDGAFVGASVTDENGSASLSLPPAHRGSKRSYSATFAGDEFYLPADSQGTSSSSEPAASPSTRAARPAEDPLGRRVLWSLRLVDLRHVNDLGT